MFLRAYLRASTHEQDAERAKKGLIEFAGQHGYKIASFYTENVSGATLQRPELMRLIEESGEGDIVLVEQIDRLARLTQRDWDTLKQKLSSKRLSIVSPELPTSWLALTAQFDQMDFTDSILQAVNAMLLDMLAAVARKDYEDRRRRQSEGIAKARAAGRYRGRQVNHQRRDQIAGLLKTGYSYSEIMGLMKCSRSLIASVAQELKQNKNAVLPVR